MDVEYVVVNERMPLKLLQGANLPVVAHAIRHPQPRQHVEGHIEGVRHPQAALHWIC